MLGSNKGNCLPLAGNFLAALYSIRNFTIISITFKTLVKTFPLQAICVHKTPAGNVLKLKNHNPSFHYHLQLNNLIFLPGIFWRFREQLSRFSSSPNWPAADKFYRLNMWSPQLRSTIKRALQGSLSNFWYFSSLSRNVQFTFGPFIESWTRLKAIACFLEISHHIRHSSVPHKLGI